MNQEDTEFLLEKIEQLENENSYLKGLVIAQEAKVRFRFWRPIFTPALKNILKRNHFVYINVIRIRSWLRK
jgi:hypothetical protein